MKNPLSYFIVIIFIFNPLTIAQHNLDQEKVGDLTVLIHNLKNNKGEVKIGLFNSEDSYNGKKEKYKGAMLKVENKQAKWVIENIPFGEYAIKAFHDEDGDDKVDTNFIGMPTERYGFSNNVKGLFGPPSFDKAKFHFDKEEMQIEIKLK